MNGAGTSCEIPLSDRWPTDEQRRSGRHKKTAVT